MAVRALEPEQLARGIVELYANAEAQIIAMVARRAGAEGAPPLENARPWEQRRLREIQALRIELERELGTITEDGYHIMRDSIERSFGAGMRRAEAELAALAEHVMPLSRAALRPVELAVGALTSEALGTVQATHTAILRTTLDAYRAVIAEAVGPTVAQAVDDRVALQRALDRFADRGITGFVDKAGRHWDLVSYADMATRTAVGRAQIAGYTDAIGERGVDLVLVDRRAERCPLCAPWEGKVLRRTSGVDGRQPTLEQARASGLFHASCTHSVSAYVPGVTPTQRPTKAQREAADRSYEERLLQRKLERNIRAAKRREAAAVTPEARRAATARVRGAQARMREFVDDTGRVRVRWREQMPRRP